MQPERKLVRNTQDSMLGGVCSGIANYFGWDVTMVRVGAALSILFFAGTPVLAYIILWAVIPSAESVYGPVTWGATQAPGYPQQADFGDAYAQGYHQAQQDFAQGQSQEKDSNL